MVAKAATSTSWPLSKVTAATHNSAPPAVGPSGALGGVDAGRRDVDPAGGQPVELGQAPSGPRAGGDDGGRGGEDRALPFADGIGLAGARAVTERHVHEHHQPHSARVGHEHGGGGRGDESVEQHHRPVGDLRHDAVQGGQRRRVGVRPGAGHLVLAHRPAARR